MKLHKQKHHRCFFWACLYETNENQNDSLTLGRVSPSLAQRVEERSFIFVLGGPTQRITEVFLKSPLYVERF
ncbi:hypothetical protein CFELI_09305 [Corynebacterium felinum]|uniref:Uncharacterized protein n=1 Tax=Corynebacterium felinum TaxID=131318 RepID=A0ABU2BBY1_9CORY|nr:hypothetical protein [Corynebacterium felinum]WJY95465.1 hypothetical protein CFELI_09305 [Corynebacterium felinum]